MSIFSPLALGKKGYFECEAKFLTSYYKLLKLAQNYRLCVSSGCKPQARVLVRYCNSLSGANLLEHLLIEITCILQVNPTSKNLLVFKE